MADEPRKIHITRKGQQFGPYPEDITKQYLEDGTLLKTDLAWHAGADGWKPLEELFAKEQETKAAEPPPPPPAPTTEAAPAGPPPDTAVHISRQGEKHGPYKYETAKIHLEGGQLLPTDSAWHEGMDGWKPLGELYPQVVPGSTGQIAAAVAPQPAVAGTYSPYDEETQKSTQFMTLGILGIVGVVLPMVMFSPFKINFPNFDLGDGKSAEYIIAMIGPLIVGITLAAMAKSTKDPVRCSVALGLSLVLMIILFSNSGVSAFGSGTRTSSMISIGGNLIVTGARPTFSSPSGMLQGQPIIFFIGLTALLMGCYARHYRPSNLPAYIIAVVGGGFLVLSCLVPAKGQGVPLIDAFKAFKGSVMTGLAMIAGLGLKIAASIICFVTTRTKSSHEVATKSDLSIKLLIGGIVLANVIILLGNFIDIFKGGGDFGPKLSFCVTMLIGLIKSLTGDGGLYLVPALAGSCLLIGSAAKTR
ncbi:MAG: DUF4339 domain-containing protein [Verrucomicrobia subdivision 3 bacterium]|nr:DUF4339 domain-containing protein [Limisphaerales bacterium]